MPRLNSRGDWCAGIGGGVITVNGATAIPYQSGGACWMDDDHVVGQHCEAACTVTTWDRVTGALTVVLGHGANFLEGGGGVWAAWFGSNDPALTGITTSYGARFPTSGLGPVGPDGALALKVEYQSAGPWDVVERSGGRWRLTNHDAGNINLLGQGRAVWSEADGTIAARGLIAPLVVTHPFYWLRVFATADAWWVLYQDATGRLLVHPFDSSVGYVVTQGNTFRPDAVYLPDGTVRVVWALTEGEPAADVRTATIPLTQPRVELDPDVLPPPIQAKPKITVASYDPLLKAGVPWALDFTNASDGTAFLVTKDAQDQLWIEAANAGGSDHTGAVRQLTVEGPDDPSPPDPPDPPDPPELPMLVNARFWCHPNIGSADLLAIFETPAALAGVEMFGLYVQQILSDESTPQLGPNTYPNLVAHDVFRKLAAAEIPLRLEMGAVKPGDCDAQQNIAGMRQALQRVSDAGGSVCTITMDEPLTANQQFCGNSLSACADAVAAFIHSVQAVDPDVAVGWVEAWPEVSIADHAAFLSDLADRNALPSYWHADIDHHRAHTEHRDPAAFLQYADDLCRQYGLTLGVLVNSTVDPIATDAEHHANLLTLASTLQPMRPDAAHVVVQSWAMRTGGTQDIPHNLGPVGLLATFAAVRQQFVPLPPQESLVLSTYIDPVGGIVPVKEVRPIKGSSLVTLVLSDDTVFSCQPDGSPGSRPAGTEGQYEKCRVLGNLATFQPAPTKYFSWPFVLVDEL